MAKQTLNVGSSPNDGTGDTLRVASTKTNDNFDEIYSTFGNGTSLSGITTASQSLVGSPNIVVGVVTATGFVSIAATPVSITWSGTTLTFSVPGVGSANLTLT